MELTGVNGLAVRVRIRYSPQKMELTGVNGLAVRVESVILHQSTKRLQRDYKDYRLDKRV